MGTAQIFKMNDVECGYCYSTNVSIVGSYETREVIVVKCNDCGKTTELDNES